MKPSQLRFFLAAAFFSALDLVLIVTEHLELRIFTKSLIIPCIIGIYMSTVIVSHTSWWKDMVVLGLMASWVGDILLQFKGMFVPGLIFFLIAHIFYIKFFTETKSQNKSFFKLRPVMLIAVVAYFIELMHLLWPHLNTMKIPVLAYGITISVMLSAALWQYQKLDDRTAVLFIFGATFFVASDSILALNKFRSPFPNAGIFTMITYILAQIFIVAGAIRYRNSSS